MKRHPIKLLTVCSCLCACTVLTEKNEPVKAEGETDTELQAPPREVESVSGLEDRERQLPDGIEPISVPCPELEKLSAKRKNLIYHLYHAVLISNDLSYDLEPPLVRRVKRLLDAITLENNTISRSLKDKIVPYAELFYLNHGVYNLWSGQKTMPTFIPGELAAATHSAVQKGIDVGLDDFDTAELGANRLEQLEAFLDSMRSYIFDPDFHETAQPQRKGGTLPTTSANLVAEQLKAAVPYASNSEKEHLERMAIALVDGSENQLNMALQSWAQLELEDEIVLGYWGDAGDNNGRTFGALVAIRDEDRNALVHKVAQKVSHYEKKLPINSMFKRAPKTITIPAVGAYQIALAAGIRAPLIKRALLLPAEEIAPDGKQRFLYLTNLVEADEKFLGTKAIREFSIDEETAFRREKWRRTGIFAFDLLKYVIGHQMGRRLVKSEEDEQKLKGPLAATMEELRTDLVALYVVYEPMSRKIGLVPEEECARAIYDEYVSQMLEQSVLSREGEGVNEPGVLARRVLVRHAIERNAVEIVRQDGRYFARVNDHLAMRKAVAKLLGEVQRIVSVGDILSAQRLIDRKGSPLPELWQEDVRSRWHKLNLPMGGAYVFPELQADRDKKGEIQNIRFSLKK